MNDSPGSPSRLDKLPWLGICLCIGALLSIKLGQDAFWDTKNYHLYNAWALLNHRYAQDIAPASMQSYFNPLLDLPYFLLSTGLLAHWPRTLAATQGLWFGALCYIALRIAFRLAQYQNRKPRWVDLIAVAVGVSGTMAVSQTGLTANEVPLGFLVLLSLYQLMPLFESHPQKPWRAAFIAGLSGGLAAGLKPTAIIYLPALGLAVLLAPGKPGRRLTLGLTFAAGAILSFLLSYGWWGLHLYHLSGNPTFPLFNQIFRSDLIPPMSMTDVRFKPRNGMEWAFYPFYWLHKRAGLVTESPFADGRYALAMLGLLLIAICKALRSRREKGREEETMQPVVRLIIAFISLSYLCWLALFSILRYAVAIESLTGIVMLIAVQAASSFARDHRIRARHVNSGMGILLLVVAATTHYPHWGRTGFGKQVFAISTGELKPGSLVLLGGIPSAYIVPFLPHALQIDVIGLNWFVGASRGYPFWHAVQQRVSKHNGPLYVVLRDGDKGDLDLLHSLVPDLSTGVCQPIASNLEQAAHDGPGSLRLCLAYRNETGRNDSREGTADIQTTTNHLGGG